MKNFTPPLKAHHAMKIMAGSVAILLLSSCTSLTKYTPRTPLPTSSEQTMPPSLSSPSPSPTVVVVAKQSQVVQSYSVSRSLPESTELTEPTELIEPLTGECGNSYRVKSGDSLSEIAYFCNVSMRQIAKLNKIPPPYVLHKNQRLQLPQKEVQRPGLTETVPESTVQLEPETVPEIVIKQEVQHSTWQWPTHKNLPYRFIRDEAGLSVVEIYGVAGQSIHAVASGSVVYSGEGIISFGKMLVIKHDDEHMSVYAHNSTLLVKEGDRIKAGQHIADLGATGNTKKPKLYLEARFQGRKIDIKKILSPPR